MKPTKSTLLSLIGSFLVGALVLLGIGGLTYHLFREGGWVSRLLGTLWEAQFNAPVITAIMIVAAIFVFRHLHAAQIGGTKDSRIPDFVLFAFIATGIFFLGRLVTGGHI